MIHANVIRVIPGPNGGTAKAFARSQQLVSYENPRGEVMFYVIPPFWMSGRNPQSGQRVSIGSIERKMYPWWTRPGWLARNVSPSTAVEEFSPRGLACTTLAASNSRRLWPWSKFLHRIRLKRKMAELVA
jgi:hypothetical protein